MSEWNKALAGAVVAATVLAGAPAGSAGPDAGGAVRATSTCADLQVGEHIWALTSTGRGARPLSCAVAGALVAKLATKPVPRRGRPYAGGLYRAQSATGMRCFGGPAAGKPPESLTCTVTNRNRRWTIRGTCEWCRPLPAGIVVRGPVDTKQGTTDPPELARYRVLRCHKTRDASPRKRGIFVATGTQNGMTLELGLEYYGPGHGEGVYEVPYGQIVNTITFEGAAGSYANANTPPNWEPGGPSGVVIFGEDANDDATDRFLGASMFILNADKSRGVGVGSLTGIAVCKYA